MKVVGLLGAGTMGLAAGRKILEAGRSLLVYDVSTGAQEKARSMGAGVSATPADYTSFAQLLLPDGTKIAQSDKPVGSIFYPTSLWQPGETLLDRHTLTVPAGAPAGPYRLLVGMYELVGGEVRTVGSTMIGD